MVTGSHYSQLWMRTGRVVDDSEPLVSTELPGQRPPRDPHFSASLFAVRWAKVNREKNSLLEPGGWWVVCCVGQQESGSSKYHLQLVWRQQIINILQGLAAREVHSVVHLTFPLYGSISGLIWDCPPDCPHITLTAGAPHQFPVSAAQLQICKMHRKEVKLITL